jgi:glycogen operon protein
MDGSRADILADRDDNDFFIMFNAGEEQTVFKVCEPIDGKKWVLAVDTAMPSPDDIYIPGNEKPLLSPDMYLLKGRSLAILLSKEAADG